MAYSDNEGYGWRLMETTMLLYVFPWVFYFNRARIDDKLGAELLRYFSHLMGLFSLLIILGLVLSGTFAEANQSIDAYYVIRTKLEGLSGLHPTYFSLMIGIALLIHQYRLKTNSNLGKEKWFIVLGSFVIFLALMLASSKMIIGAMLVTSLLIWAQGRSFISIIKIGSFTVVGLLLIILILRPLRERVVTMVVALNQEQLEEHNPDSMRKAIYKCATEAISENWLFGVGLGDQQDELNAKYAKYDFQLAGQRKFNTHNQYLQFWLATGILPFFLFILLQLAQIGIAIASRNILHLAIVLLFSFSLLTENLLSRQDGVFIYILFSSFLVYYSWSKIDKEKYINGRFLKQSLTGVQRFAREISKRLIQKDSSFRLIVPAADDDHKNAQVARGLQGTLWEQITLPVYLKLSGSPILVNLCNAAPILYRNQFSTIHDLAFKVEPSWFSERFVSWYDRLIPKVIKHSKQIFTVSEFSKAELISNYQVSPDKITVVYNGIPEFSAENDRSALISGDYILAVGTLSPRKNQAFLIDAFKNSNEYGGLKLVIAGGLDDDVYGKGSEAMQMINQNEHIIFINQPSDADLINLYKHALFTAYLPFYEGFGIPILEAMSFKKAVLVSDIQVFRELFQDSVEYAQLDNYEHIRAQILKLSTTAELRDDLVRKSEAIVQKYSYLKSAERMQEVMAKSEV